MFEKAEVTEQSESGRSYPMAMWGAAMSTTQLLWSYSNCEKGKEYLQRIPMVANWTTEKEKAYIKTLFALYPKDVACEKDSSQFVRENRFMKAMKQLIDEYPEETEAALFYAVAQTAVTAHHDTKRCDDCSSDPKQEIIDQLRYLEEKVPTHSGLYHYIIHVFDSPELYTKGNKLFLHKMVTPSEQKNHVASMGIRAAVRYPQVANSSCHALHMPSHIYMRIGDWTRSLESNLLSIQVK